MTASRLVHPILLGSISATFHCRYSAEYTAKRGLWRKLLENTAQTVYIKRGYYLETDYFLDWISKGTTYVPKDKFLILFWIAYMCLVSFCYFRTGQVCSESWVTAARPPSCAAQPRACQRAVRGPCTTWLKPLTTGNCLNADVLLLSTVKFFALPSATIWKGHRC